MKTFIDCIGYTLLAEPLGKSKETLLARYTIVWTGYSAMNGPGNGPGMVSIKQGLRTTDYGLCIKQGLSITFGPRTMILKIERIISK